MTEYRVIPWAEAITLHSADWLAIGLERGLNPTLLPDWTRIIVETLTDPGAVRVLIGTDGARLVSLLPFHVRNDHVSGIPVRILEPISSVVSFHAELVSRDDHADLLQALIQTRREIRWDILRLAAILLETPSARAIVDVARTERVTLNEWPGEASPYLPLLASGEKMLASRDKRDRYRIRKHAKDFAAIPGATERWYGRGDDMAALLQAILHVEAGSWKQAAGVAVSADPRETEYFRRLLLWLEATDRLFANVYFVNTEPVAYNLSYTWEGTIGCMKGTYLQNFAHLSLGHHAQDQQIFRFADAGGKECDFLGNAEPYKLGWTSTTRRHSDFFLYAPRGRGRLLGFAQRLRNRLRKSGGNEREPGPT